MSEETYNTDGDIDETERSGETDHSGSSRRRFLGGTAAAGAGLLTVGGTGITAAQSDGDEDGVSTDEEGTDVDVLNYALSLEHVENNFYETAFDTFSEEEFLEAEPIATYGDQAGVVLYDALQVAGEHEAAHVELLTRAIELLGGEPVEEGEYDFGLESVEDFLELGATLENTGVAAYAGAAPAIESPDLLRTALGIHSVEARHATVIQAAAGSDPFPGAVDEPLTVDEVLEALQPILAESDDDEEDN